MTCSEKQTNRWKRSGRTISLLSLLLSAGIAIPAIGAGTNLLQNPGFEDPSDASGNAPQWTLPTGITAKPQLTDQTPRTGKQALILPAHGAVEQTINAAKAGAYVARAWVKSQADQSISLLVQDPNQGWMGFTLAEIKVPANQWTQIEIFCSLQKDGTLTYTLGELSGDFRNYHGVSAATRNPIEADDLELIRYEVKTPAPVTSSENKVQSDRLVGVAKSDGSLEISAKVGDQLKPRCTIVPSIAIPNAKIVPVEEPTRKGLKISSEKGDISYTAWFTPEGLVTLSADHIPQFQVKNCHLQYGLLPSFIGTDILYAPKKMKENTFNIPSTQWLVGLVDGNDSMLTVVWESDTQPVSLGLTGEGESRRIDSLTIGTEKAGFSLALAENKNIWHKETLKEEWLGGNTPIAWERPFQARWMCQFYVSPATKPTFRDPNMEYSFPVASARTRLFGQCFEDFNRYPFYFEGSQLVFHFEKSFTPKGDALVYFLEPAFADLISPCEVVEMAMGPVKAKALFDYEGNALRKLKYSTPDEFMYDRPVCATTTRLNNIKQSEKATIGVSLATHIYEFVREIRRRVDEYSSFYNQVQDYLGSEKKAHPEFTEYLEELEAMVTDAQGRAKPIYNVSLASIKEKTDGVKEQMLNGTGDGFKFGNLDCRDRAGEQDDLCRRNHRFVMRLVQAAAQKCGDDPKKAKIAQQLWIESRAILKQPTRWEPRRTLYFLEP